MGGGRIVDRRIGVQAQQQAGTGVDEVVALLEQLGIGVDFDAAAGLEAVGGGAGVGGVTFEVGIELDVGMGDCSGGTEGGHSGQLESLGHGCLQ